MKMARKKSAGLHRVWAFWNNIYLYTTYYICCSPAWNASLNTFDYRCWCSAFPVPSPPPASLSLELSLPTTECQWPGWDPTQCPQCRHLSGSESGGVATEWPGHLEGSGGGCLQTCWWGDTKSWPETSPRTIRVSLCLTIPSVVILLHPVTLCLDVAISYLALLF